MGTKSEDQELVDWETEEALAQQQGEIYAEFVMSWVMGGGSADEANWAWNSGIAHANGYSSAPEGWHDDDEHDEGRALFDPTV